MERKHVLLLDGASLWFRAFFGIPDKITAPDGRPVNAIRGFLDMVAYLIESQQPTRLVVCEDWDWRPAFRTDLIPSYKAHRVAEASPTSTAPAATDSAGLPDVEEVPDLLTPQVPVIAAALDAAGIARAGATGCEADDVIGTLAAAERSAAVTVVSGDRDLLQVVTDEPPTVRVLYVGRGVSKAELFGPEEVAAKYGVPVAGAGRHYAELAMLRGDPSDGLPGVAGIGEKTAAQLLTQYGSLDAVEAAMASGAAGISARRRDAITAGADYLHKARTVVLVRTDAPVHFVTGSAANETVTPAAAATDALPTQPAAPADLAALASEYGIGSSVRRLATALRWPSAALD